MGPEAASGTEVRDRKADIAVFAGVEMVRLQKGMVVGGQYKVVEVAIVAAAADDCPRLSRWKVSIHSTAVVLVGGAADMNYAENLLGLHTEMSIILEDCHTWIADDDAHRDQKGDAENFQSQLCSEVHGVDGEPAAAGKKAAGQHRQKVAARFVVHVEIVGGASQCRLGQAYSIYLGFAEVVRPEVDNLHRSHTEVGFVDRMIVPQAAT